MTSLRALLSTLASQAGPVLTVYSKERVEFNGPVLARWFSKISNLLSEELGADLFGEGEAHRGRFFIRHELWQEIVWTVPLLALGWTRFASLEDAAPGDLVLVSTIDEDALAAYESGATVLAQPREYLTFSWRGDPLPTGILDALAEVMAQPDTLEGMCLSMRLRLRRSPHPWKGARRNQKKMHLHGPVTRVSSLEQE